MPPDSHSAILSQTLLLATDGASAVPRATTFLTGFSSSLDVSTRRLRTLPSAFVMSTFSRALPGLPASSTLVVPFSMSASSLYSTGGLTSTVSVLSIISMRVTVSLSPSLRRAPRPRLTSSSLSSVTSASFSASSTRGAEDVNFLVSSSALTVIFFGLLTTICMPLRGTRAERLTLT